MKRKEEGGNESDRVGRTLYDPFGVHDEGPALPFPQKKVRKVGGGGGGGASLGSGSKFKEDDEAEALKQEQSASSHSSQSCTQAKSRQDSSSHRFASPEPGVPNRVPQTARAPASSQQQRCNQAEDQAEGHEPWQQQVAATIQEAGAARAERPETEEFLGDPTPDVFPNAGLAWTDAELACNFKQYGSGNCFDYMQFGKCGMQYGCTFHHPKILVEEIPKDALDHRGMPLPEGGVKFKFSRFVEHWKDIIRNELRCTWDPEEKAWYTGDYCSARDAKKKLVEKSLLFWWDGEKWCPHRWELNSPDKLPYLKQELESLYSRLIRSRHVVV